MDNVRENQEIFEVLGYRLKLKKNEELNGVSPSDIVGFVQSEAHKIFKESPQLAPHQVAVLLSLKFAGEKLALEKEYRESISQLQITAIDALQYIEDVSPTTR